MRLACSLLIAVSFFAGAWPAAAAAGRDRLRARFGEALSHESAGRCQIAAPQFQRLWHQDALLRPYYAYHAAACQLRLGDRASALAWADRVPAGSIPEAEAALIRLDVLVAQRRWAEVLRRTDRFLDQFPLGPRRVEAEFQRAVALEGAGRTTDAARLLRDIWASSRSDTWSSRAEARLVALEPRLSAEGREAARKRAADWVGRGQVLFDRHQNEDSEAAFARALAAPGLTPALACQARYHQAQSVWKQRTRARALPLFAEAAQVCQAAGDRDLAARAMYQRGRCLVSTGDGPQGRAQFAALEAAHADHRLADDARLRAAEVAWEAGDERMAVDLASEIPRRYPQGDMLGEALWRLAYRRYRAGDLADARRWLEENRRLVPRASIWYAEGRPEYWLGRIAEKQGDAPAARRWYQRALQDYPLSVYALQAAQRLNEIAPAEASALLRRLRRPDSTARIDSGPGPATRQPAPAWQRAIELAAVGLGREAQRELAAPDGDTLAAAALLDGAGLWNASHALVDQKLPEFRRAYPAQARPDPWTLAYPRAYGDLVEARSRENGVPSALQLALMREESAFDPRAVSTANCLGLTMLKPETARELLSPKIRREEIFDPPTNIAGGSRHLAYLLRKFGAVAPAIAAYNAGEGAVGRWLREFQQLPVDEFLEAIPFEETRGYTKRVLASYFAYHWLYAPGDPIPPLVVKPASPG